MTQDELYAHLVTNFYYHTDGLLKNIETHEAVGIVVPAGAGKTRLQYAIKGRNFYVHRLIYLLANGDLPNDLIDHVDRNPMNNRIENLRPASFSENQWNRSKNRNNKSGVKGIFIQKNGKHLVRVGFKNKNYYVGTFDDMVSAVQSRVAYVEKLHHMFACHG